MIMVKQAPISRLRRIKWNIWFSWKWVTSSQFRFIWRVYKNTPVDP